MAHSQRSASVQSGDIGHPRPHQRRAFVERTDEGGGVALVHDAMPGAPNPPASSKDATCHHNIASADDDIRLAHAPAQQINRRPATSGDHAGVVRADN
ncbi:MAG: hypothetical protein J0I23_01910 [Rhizobiales bacterium]|nr:hypothetical protein [Hyphomicrobiales bacterium]